MKKKQKIGLGVTAAVIVVVAAGWYLHAHLIPVLQPAGSIGTKERNLIIFTVSISAAVVIPVFGLLAYFGWKYREGNTRAKYTPDLDGNARAETIWWLIPTFIMVIISLVTWRSSYALDPFKPIASSKPVLHIQAVSIDWKWLFIYPDQGIASVNQLAIPVDTPVDFELTSDSVMTSFWVPQLGGQMYAMPGMTTHLNLEAVKPGRFNGSTANISGTGFADQTFIVHAMPSNLFSLWKQSVGKSPLSLTNTRYAALAQPSVEKSPIYYSSVTNGLFDSIVMKYMMPMGAHATMHGMAM